MSNSRSNNKNSYEINNFVEVPEEITKPEKIWFTGQIKRISSSKLKYKGKEYILCTVTDHGNEKDYNVFLP